MARVHCVGSLLRAATGVEPHSVLTRTRAVDWLRAAFYLTATFSFVMAVMPQPPRMPGQLTDKVLHVLAFAVLALLAALAFPATFRLKLVVLLSLFGALIEVAQLIPSLHRDSDPVDWIADTISAVIVIGLMTWWRDDHRRSPPSASEGAEDGEQRH